MRMGSRGELRKSLSLGWSILGNFDLLEMIYSKSLNRTNSGQKANLDSISILQKKNYDVIISC